MKRYILLAGILCFALSSFAQLQKQMVKVFKATDRTELLKAAKGYQPKVLQQRYMKNLTKSVDELKSTIAPTAQGAGPALRMEMSHAVIQTAHEWVLPALPKEEVFSLGASLLENKEIRGLNESGFSFTPNTLKRKQEIPFNPTDEVEFMLNGETMPLDRQSGHDALQLARILDESLKEFAPKLQDLSLEQYAVFNVLHYRFQKAYNTFKTKGVWEINESLPIVKQGWVLVSSDTSAFFPVLKKGATNQAVLNEAQVTSDLAAAMADLMLFMGRGSNNAFFGVFQALPNTLNVLETKNKISQFIFRNSINR